VLYQIQGETLDELYIQGLRLLHDFGRIEKTRNGPAMVVPYPVMTIWDDPTKRVLLDENRNCNHAFHINEAIWMLKGENNALLLDPFIHDFSSRFAESDGKLHGAYGRRWFHTFGMNQIDHVINILKKDLSSRQAVISMWDAGLDLGTKVKDKPCNTHLYFRIDGLLNMTICNRSNDMIWGLYGANAVHFSILLEVIAGALGVEVGKMYTLSNNFHAYTNVFDKTTLDFTATYPYDSTPLIEGNYNEFMWDVQHWSYGKFPDRFKTDWFNGVAYPVTMAFFAKKNGDINQAKEFISCIIDENWQIGMKQWLYHAKHN